MNPPLPDTLDNLEQIVQADLRARWERLRLHPTQTYTLERCKILIAENQKETFQKERANWIKAISLHTSQTAVEIATLLFEWYFANQETERADVLRIWKKLLERSGESQGMPRETAILLRQIGILQVSRGYLNDAEKYLRQSTQISEQVQDQILVGNNYYELGLIYRNAGKYKPAWDAFITAVESSKKTGNLKAQIYAQGQLANILAVQGDFDKAINILKETLNLWKKFPESGDRDMSHTTLHTLGSIYIQNGQPLDAIEVLKQSLYLKQKLKERFDLLVRTDTMLAEAFISLGQFDQAQNCLAEADVESCAKMGSYLYAATSFKTLSQLHFAQNNFHQAQRFANRALDVARQSNNPLVEFDVLLWIFSADWQRRRLLNILPRVFVLITVLFRMRLSPRQFFQLSFKRLKRFFDIMRLKQDHSAGSHPQRHLGNLRPH